MLSDHDLNLPTHMTQGDWRTFVHEMNNHTAIMMAFFTMVDREKFVGDDRQLFNNARKSLDEVMDLVEGIGL